MKWLLRAALALLGCGGLFTAIGVAGIPPDAVGLRGDTTLAPGLHPLVVGTPETRPVAGRVVLGPPGELPRLSVQTADEQRAELSLAVEWHALGDRPPADAEVEAALRPALAKHFATRPLRELVEPVSLEELAVAARDAADAALSGSGATAGWVHVHDVRVSPEAEGKLRSDLMGMLQAQTEEAQEHEVGARQAADALLGEAGDTLEATQTEWDAKDAALRAELGGAAASARAETDEYVRRKEAEAEGIEARMRAEGELAMARAEAERDRLTAEALQGDAGRLYTAIQAARSFRASELAPELRAKLTTMAAWRAFFLR